MLCDYDLNFFKKAMKLQLLLLLLLLLTFLKMDTVSKARYIVYPDSYV